ncbi:MAG TPA: anthranilate synthase component I family protein [Sediminibacterium sp.]|nr:anthranilate synthase component I family protein [Sediminibacterium sp.]
MKKNKACFNITGIPDIKQQMLAWLNRFSICCFLDNHQYHSTHHSVEWLAAAGSVRSFTGPQALTEIDRFYQTEADWLFGHIGFEFPEEPKQNLTGFTPIHFFQPQTVLQLCGNELSIETFLPAAEAVFEEIRSMDLNAGREDSKTNKTGSFRIQPQMSRASYIATVQQLLQHIQRGDCYEINFCQQFFAEEAAIDPIKLYADLTSLSPNPFSCFYRQQEAHLLCASPERFLQRKSNRLISQPIKGTIRRNTNDAAEDHLLKKALQQSSKEQSENVMVVDLVRNDLSRVCSNGSVTVEELFGIYSFPQVHQMISTISGLVEKGTSFSEIIRATFPMGSMTGAPKKRVLELIRQYEPVPRGVFSGTVGYINPQQDFDFNVVIRSILYNASTQYLSYLVGSGITFYCDPEAEYEECLLKAEAINVILGQ